MNIKPEQFEKAVMKALAEYGDHTLEVLEQETKSAGRQTAKDLKAAAPHNSGRYAAGWSHKHQKGGAYKLSDTAYNRTDYQLTHLLEKPHDTWNGGHYPKYKDHTGIIARIEEENKQKFVSEVLAKL